MVRTTPNEDRPQQLRLAYIDWRLARLGRDLQNLDDSYAPGLITDIRHARRHLSQNAADGSTDRLDDARRRVPTPSEGVTDHPAVLQLCRMVLHNCEAILHDYLDIRDADFPADEDDYASPQTFPAWDRFRDDTSAPRG